eukprot:51041-Prorocentrum_lima.AAC.1
MCQEAYGPMVRHHLRTYRAENLGTLHVDLTGPFGIQGERGSSYLLIMAHRIKLYDKITFIPWA